MNDNSSIKIARLITLEKKFRNAESETELGFICANELRSIVDYNFLFLLNRSSINRLKVNTISDLSVIDRTAPTVAFIEGLLNKKGMINSDEVSAISLQSLDLDKVNLSIPENFPNHLVFVPLSSRIEKNIGYLVLVRTEPVTSSEKDLLLHISESFSHALTAFGSKKTVLTSISRIFTGWVKWLVIASITVVMFFPISMSALAPVEVVAKDPTIVTSPVNGVVEKVLIKTNENVKPGTELVKLDDLNFKNQYEIALQKLEVAEAELLRVKQSSFSNEDDKARLVELSTEVGLRKKEATYAEEQLKYSIISAEREGIAVVEDFTDWQGRPVTIGEKILTIADPQRIEFQIFLPTKDSLLIKKEARVKVFLDSDPLNSLEGEVLRTSYKPALTAENILAYQIFAKLDENQGEVPRIGLRGTAKIYGEKTSIFYYIFRVPINLTRQFLGF